jgi:hypothetical protein
VYGNGVGEVVHDIAHLDRDGLAGILGEGGG